MSAPPAPILLIDVVNQLACANPFSCVRAMACILHATCRCSKQMRVEFNIKIKENRRDNIMTLLEEEERQGVLTEEDVCPTL